MKKGERDAYKKLLVRRSRHEPLQYILGKTEFMSLDFDVNPDVLIPRPETEILVEQVIEIFRSKPEPRCLDIGTGSGCISISLAFYLKNAMITAVDISNDIIKLAKRNSEKNNVSSKINFIIGDLFSDSFIGDLNSPYDVVVSNPPYVSADEWSALPVEIRNHEPATALCDNEDGLRYYRRLSHIIPEILTPGGRFFMEIGEKQADEAASLFEQQAFRNVHALPDLNGIARVVTGQLK
jgi:release factor glutamine methyltransferase